MLTAVMGAAYFFVWTLFGMAAFPFGAAMAANAMQQPALARAVPMAVATVVKTCRSELSGSYVVESHRDCI